MNREQIISLWLRNIKLKGTTTDCLVWVQPVNEMKEREEMGLFFTAYFRIYGKIIISLYQLVYQSSRINKIWCSSTQTSRQTFFVAFLSLQVSRNFSHSTGELKIVITNIINLTYTNKHYKQQLKGYSANVAVQCVSLYLGTYVH